MQILTDRKYDSIRGFNYQPSYDYSGLNIWRHFRADIIEKELGLGKKHFPGINTIRAWLCWEAFLENPKLFRSHFDQYLDIASKYDLKVIPTLFNGWHSIPNFGGIVVGQLQLLLQVDQYDIFSPYLESLIGGHADDERILMWDLCNEPINNTDIDVDGLTDVKKIVIDWLAWLAQHVRTHQPNAPICVGSNTMELLALTEPFTDVLTYHHYWAYNAWLETKEQYIQAVEDTIQFANDKHKPLLVTECCWGALDDAKRAELGRTELEALKSRGVGFVAHLLHHSLVADAHRPSCGPVTAAGYMAFVEADGSLRPGHEFFNQF